MDLGLNNKIALITGASRGLGYATARLLSQEGALLAINSRNVEKLSTSARSIQKATGNKVFPIPGDITQAGIPEKLVESVVNEYGGLDILFANAGGPPPGLFEALDDQAWQKAFDLTFLSYVRLIRAALPYLKKSSAASILTVTSLSTKQPIPNLILSNSIRSATISLTKSLAMELGKDGIRVNSILPSWTDTERIQDLLKNRAQLNGTTLEEERLKQSLESPLGRLARPQEFANVAVFLLSPAASYLTGSMISVDGGVYKGIY